MKILLSCLQSLHKHSIPAHDFWRSYFVEGCREAGIEPLEVPGVDWAEGLTYCEGTAELESWKSRTWGKTLSFVREEHSRGGVDLFLGYLYPQQVEVASIKEMQRTGIPCVNFFCDNVREFRKVPEVYTTFDLHWVPEYEALSMYQQAHLPHIHAAMPCWIPKHLRSVPKREEGPAVFVGSADILRRNLLSQALEAGADFMLHGKGWASPSDEAVPFCVKKEGFLARQAAFLRRHGLSGMLSKVENKMFPLPTRKIPQPNAGRILSSKDYIRVTREAPVVLGVSRVPSPARPLQNPLKYSRLRDIEAPMLGACYLTEWTQGLDKLYDLGVEVESYRSAEELVEKLRMLSSCPKLRFELRRLGQRRALQDHNVCSSIRKIITTLQGRLS